MEDRQNVSRVKRKRPRPMRRDAVDMPAGDWLRRYYIYSLRPEIETKRTCTTDRLLALGRTADLDAGDAWIREEDNDGLWDWVKEIATCEQWARLRAAWRRHLSRRGAR